MSACGCRVNIVASPIKEAEYLIAYCPLHASAERLAEAVQKQHEAIDTLFAKLIGLDAAFYPSKSGKPWEALQAGLAALKAAGRMG